MHVLVTGGAGYIGTTLVPHLLQNDCDVTVVDRFYFGRDLIEGAVEDHAERVELVRADICDLEASDLEVVDVVIDLAGISNDPTCALNPELTRRINKRGSIHMADLSAQAGVDRHIFASSCSVYGHGEDLGLTEEAPTNPMTLYAECKVAAEEGLFESAAREDVTATALRFATVFGLSPRMRFDLAINIMTQKAYIDSKVDVYGGGLQWRPFVHVKDIARAICTTIQAPRETVDGRVYNVGANQNNLQIRNLAYRIRDRIPGTEINMTETDPDLRTYNVCFDRIRDELDFEPHKTIEDGIDEVVAALASGRLTHDERRWYTLDQYQLLEEVQTLYPQLEIDGSIL